MECLILVGSILCAAIIVYGIGRLIRSYRESKQRDAERKAALEARLEQMRQEAYDKVRKANSAPVKKVEVPPRGKETTVSYNATSDNRRMTTTSSDDGFVNGMLTGMLIDSVVDSFTHKSGGSNPVDFPEQRSVGISKSESSWGFDDSDSRKSISDTFSSSSSDSSWSSSDSSPSSDW